MLNYYLSERKNQSRLLRDAGLSLIETLLALSLITFFLLSVSKTLSTSVKNLIEREINLKELILEQQFTLSDFNNYNCSSELENAEHLFKCNNQNGYLLLSLSQYDL